MSGLYRFSWTVLRLLARILFGYRVHGDGKIPPRGAFILASNHVSYADPIVAGLGVRRELHFLAKRELFAMPVIRWWIRRHHAIPVKRGGVERSTLRLVASVLAGGGALLLFPEGTRSRDGTVGAPQPGVGMIASRNAVPIYPVYVRGTRGILRSLLHRGRLATFIGESIDPAGFTGADRKELYQAIAVAVADRVRKMRERHEG